MLNIYMLIMYMYIIIFCMFNYFYMNKHLLCLLLSLEFFMLLVYFLINFILMNMSNEFYMGLYYLTISVCEGGLGLSLLVMLIRSHGNEMINSFIMNI
uniref:NADH-ubiquinone oxidoreductase chain 4L n=4 Tax=Pantopoda TaxID=373319 RepID=E3SHF3_AMMCA|nr:NADH dehydrogenase subunit 4L [Ammothea carolinensis]ACY00258.1 NADH dehydrogenase subunit 4L [Ammothea carolinensis]